MQRAPAPMFPAAFDNGYDYSMHADMNTPLGASNRNGGMYLSSPNSPNTAARFSTRRDGGPIIDAAKYKTKLCRNYLMKVPCPFEDKCVFAHGEDQIRPNSLPTSPNVQRNDSYEMNFPTPPTRSRDESTNTSYEHLPLPRSGVAAARAAAAAAAAAAQLESKPVVQQVSLPAPPSYEDFMQGTSPDESEAATPTMRCVRFRYEPYSQHGIVFEN